MSQYPELFSPFRLGPRILKNRLVMPGMATMYSNMDGSVSPQMVAYYHKRARGGVGTIILEYTSVAHPEGLGGVTQLQLADPKVIPGFREIVDSVEPYGTTLLVQLHHSGLRAVKSPGTTVVGPVDQDGVHGLTVEEIQGLVAKFAQAAVHAKRAGIHGVEIHAGHGYLLNQFLSPATNTRTDEYGGDVAGRCRFLLEVIRAVRAAVGSEMIISVRLAVRDWLPGGITVEDGVEFAKLVDAEDVNLINLTSGLKYGYTSNSETQDRPDGFRLDLAHAVRPHVSHPIAIVGKLRTGEMCNQIIADGIADLAVVGRQLIADPEWPNKLQRGQEDQTRVCLNCLDGCYSALAIESGIRCAINPYVGFESQFDEGNLPPVKDPKRVVVVGGGLTGMQAALTAAERGNNVTLLSDAAELGGQLELAAVAPHKEVLRTLPAYFKGRLDKEGVEVVSRHHATVASVLDLRPEVAILATGSKPVTAPIKGIERGVQAWNVLDGSASIEPGQRVVIIGGGSVGCDTALTLLARGVEDITLLEMTNTFARGQEATHQLRDLTELKAAGVGLVGSCRVDEVTESTVEYSLANGEAVSAPADVVVISTGQRPVENGLAEGLREAGIEVRLAGDAVRMGNIRMNTRSGFLAGFGY